MNDAFSEAMAAERADMERRRLARVSRCPQCGRPATGAEWDLLRHAQAMNYALGRIRYAAEAHARDGMVPADAILRALDGPYRFPLPEGPR